MKSCEIGGKNPNCDQIKRLKKITSEMPGDDEIYKDSETIKALADPTRLKIVYLLRYGELCVCEIMEALEKPQATVSHHLNILKNAGFLKWRKEGVWTHYRLSNSKIHENINELLKNH
ncbi:ArsR/SmtB family transcription factor [Methanobacterium paludis]|uniref:Transcriptional regulator, ArsR family n=1 Tax=Methanobacterium paludis (strain DSM 25820 / JCM 18151 / SWAN1) TaxID=868131 RepID=F6D7P4_METPW|nr:metalloregulator ArsR/SmtB family transcription factor [Methanobacterium paludis]AEG17123.1 transcriptional regulator, ArsR family [Methanobacterium paludis]